MIPCVGLFGTCGQSRWRLPFIARYQALGIPFFNPQVPEGTWHPGLVEDENRHLREDAVILFPVTDETTGQGSLAEIGFSISAALRASRSRWFIFLVDDRCRDPKATPAQILDSENSRVLVKSKLKDEARRSSSVFLVETLDEMLDLSLELWDVQRRIQAIEAARKTGVA